MVKVPVLIGLRLCRMRAAICSYDTCPGLNLIRDDVPEQSWLENIRQRDMTVIRSASVTKQIVSALINLHRSMRESCIAVIFGVVYKLAVRLLLGKTFTGRFVESIYPTERKRFPHHFPCVTVLIVNEAEIEAEKNTSDIQQFHDPDLTLLVTPTKSQPEVHHGFTKNSP